MVSIQSQWHFISLVTFLSTYLVLTEAATMRPNNRNLVTKIGSTHSQQMSSLSDINSMQSLYVNMKNKIISSIIPTTTTIATALLVTSTSKAASADASKGKLEYQPALQGLDYGKPRTYYPDYTQKPSGLQYKAVKEGTGKSPKAGDRVVVDWEGYTIGYYGRPFQTRNKVKGGAFDKTEEDNLRWVVGSGSVVAALDEAVQYMKEGGVTQVIVPAELGYPAKGDSEHDLVGPKPTSFSGQRALNFVLENQNLIDKTLLINIRLIRVDEKYSSTKRNK